MITREEFDRLLEAYADAYGKAVFAVHAGGEEFKAVIDKAVEAKGALERAVFTEGRSDG